MARLFGSIIFGALWTVRGVEPAVLIFGGALLVALAGAATLLARAGQLSPTSTGMPTDGLYHHDD
jgi:hypothetical protein